MSGILIVTGKNKRGRIEFQTACTHKRGAEELTKTMTIYGITVATRRANKRESAKWLAYLLAIEEQ